MSFRQHLITPPSSKQCACALAEKPRTIGKAQSHGFAWSVACSKGIPFANLQRWMNQHEELVDCVLKPKNAKKQECTRFVVEESLPLPRMLRLPFLIATRSAVKGSLLSLCGCCLPTGATLTPMDPLELWKVPVHSTLLGS